MSAAALETRGLCKSFGALTVADQIDFRLERGARQALIGPCEVRWRDGIARLIDEQLASA